MKRARVLVSSVAALCALAVILLVIFAGAGCNQASTQATPPPLAPGQPPANLKLGPTTQSQVHLALVTNAVSAFWNPMVKGMERAAKQLGCKAEWQGPQDGSVETQRQILENFVSQKVDGICLSPINKEALSPVINDLVDKGLVVCCFDSDAPGSKRMAYIGTNNYQAGRECGKAALKVIGNKPTKCIAFVGRLESENAHDRLQGFKDATKGIIDVVDVRQDQSDKTKARKNVEEVLTAQPDVTLLLGLWSYNGPSIAQAVLAAKRRDKVKIVCFDAEPATLDHLAKGEIDATVVQKPFYFGYLAVELMYDMVKCGVKETQMLLPKGQIVDTGVQVVTPDNVEEYKQYLKSIGIESS